ncbi:MAG: glutamyl-tRNA reductase, partial [Bacteroidetes bacterium]
MEMPFSVVSLSHQKAPVAIRELIYLPEQACRKLLVDFRDILGLEEVLLFSTCNRTEVYYRGGRDFSEEIIQLICIENGIDSWREYLPYFRIIREEEAALAYLFEVSMGLHSQVLGDLQIASQVKHAYRWTHEAGMASAYLHRLMHTIFHTNKRVQQETPYRDGAASVSYAAAELAAELCSQFEAPRALVVGLGEMGRDVARNLDPTIFDAIHLMNRSYSKAAKLATETGHTALPLEEL